MSLRAWERKVLAAPGAARRVAAIEAELRAKRILPTLSTRDQTRTLSRAKRRRNRPS